MKINKMKLYKFISKLLIIYPFIDILIAYIYKGDNMLTFHLILSTVIMIAFVFAYKFEKMYKVNILIAIIFTIGICTICIDATRKQLISEFSFSVKLLFAMMFLFYFNDYEFYGIFSNVLVNYRKLWLIINIAQLVILSLSMIGGNGNYSHWGTMTLKGPYDLNHTLAYLLLFTFCGNVFLYLKSKKRIYFILGMIDVVLMLLTGVRSVLVIIFLVFLFVFRSMGVKGKIIYMIYAVLLLSIGYSAGAFDPLIEKTMYAAVNSSVSNGRGEIWKSSIEAYMSDKSLVNKMIGIGMTSLKQYNLKNIGFSIHAHNDFITVLVCYGPVAFSAFVISIIKTSKNLFLLLFICGLIFLNGFITYGQAIIMICFAITLFKALKEKSNICVK